MRMASSTLAIAASFVLFFLVLGFMWTVGIYIIDQVIQSTVVQPGSQWHATYMQSQDQIKTIFLFLPPVLFLLACIKLIANAVSSGRD